VRPEDALPDDLAGESRFQLLTRLGFAGRGLLYIVIGLLVIFAGRTEDLTGALEYLGHGVGKLLLVVLVVGMAVYGLWRLTDAAFGIESGRHHWKAWRKRIAAGTSGIIYSFLAYKAVRILLSQRVSGNDAQQRAADAFDLPRQSSSARASSSWSRQRSAASLRVSTATIARRPGSGGWAESVMRLAGSSSWLSPGSSNNRPSIAGQRKRAGWNRRWISSRQRFEAGWRPG
jgi:hypothetical protein